MRTQSTYYYRGTEGQKDAPTDGRNDGRTVGGKDGQTEGRKAKNYVPPLFFEKAGDKNICLLHGQVFVMQNGTNQPAQLLT